MTNPEVQWGVKATDPDGSSRIIWCDDEEGARFVMDVVMASEVSISERVIVWREVMPTVEECAEDCYERMTCPHIGGFGHQQCGRCTEHGGPRHHCGCLVAYPGATPQDKTHDHPID